MEYITHFVPNAGVIGAYDQDTIHMKLKNGQVLCQLMNGLVPGSIKKINTNNMAFKQMENIGNFLAQVEKFGVNPADSFQTVDLYEKQNMPLVERHRVKICTESVRRNQRRMSENSQKNN